MGKKIPHLDLDSLKLKGSTSLELIRSAGSAKEENYNAKYMDWKEKGLRLQLPLQQLHRKHKVTSSDILPT